MNLWPRLKTLPLSARSSPMALFVWAWGIKRWNLTADYSDQRRWRRRGQRHLETEQLQANHERVSSFPTSQASVRPSHPNIAGTTREVGSRPHSGFKESPVRVNQSLLSN